MVTAPQTCQLEIRIRCREVRVLHAYVPVRLEDTAIPWNLHILQALKMMVYHFFCSIMLKWPRPACNIAFKFKQQKYLDSKEHSRGCRAVRSLLIDIGTSRDLFQFLSDDAGVPESTNQKPGFTTCLVVCAILTQLAGVTYLCTTLSIG